jgi:hypothetical protein
VSLVAAWAAAGADLASPSAVVSRSALGADAAGFSTASTSRPASAVAAAGAGVGAGAADAPPAPFLLAAALASSA